jgi:NAD(P)-dependent dehydrogenase (short-subunit alcohol dehydrogenase family)
LARRDVQGLALVDRSERVHQLAEEVNKKAGKELAHAYVGDVTSDEFRRSVFGELHERHGMVNICVPAAGVARDGLAVKLNKETDRVEVYPIEQFREVMEVNLVAPVYWAVEMLAGVAEDRRRRGLKRWNPTDPIQGAIVFIGSVSSLGNKGQVSYATTKAGLEGATATLMAEAIFHGVRCGIIHPGYTDTPMVRALGEKFIQEKIIPQTQLRRLIRPEEIADAICFMIQNTAVSGSLWADAGWHPAA